MQLAGHDIGVCSWSLRTRSLAELVQAMGKLGLEHVQLALGGLLGPDTSQRDKELGHIRDAGITITAGMMGFAGEDYSTITSIRRTGGLVPDDQWPARRQLMDKACELSASLNLPRLSTHIGFIPASSQPGYKVMLQRVSDVARPLADKGIDLVLETGQESASELLQFLNDLPVRNVHANFDPANMILYGAGDPIDAIGILGRHIGHVHVKDALLSPNPGQEWGREVPFGDGQVGARRFLDALKGVGYSGPLVIEREGGEDRIADVAAAIDALRSAAGE
jgi:sugar phosphate isomerase/epimerase